LIRRLLSGVLSFHYSNFFIMIESVIRLAVKNKLVVGVVILGIVIAGIYNLNRLPFDAVPDITNNQVQVVTVSNSLAPQEIEQLITYPVEVAMANIPNVSEIRSISRFGLSVVTVVFEDRVPVLEARQFVKEQIGQAVQEIPADLGTPELMPITTGAGRNIPICTGSQPRL
jgi:cobalt-zinc-cadmium resistance protein CzcA